MKCWEPRAASWCVSNRNALGEYRSGGRHWGDGVMMPRVALKLVSAGPSPTDATRQLDWGGQPSTARCTGAFSDPSGVHYILFTLVKENCQRRARNSIPDLYY